MIYLLYLIHVVVSLFLILVVLLQQGKGADLSVFGGGATQAAFGARGAASLLHKLTVWGFVAFIVTTVSIGFMVSSKNGGSVMSNLPEQEATETATDVPAQPVDAGTAEEQPAEAVGEGTETGNDGTMSGEETSTDDAGEETEDGTSGR